MPHYPNPTRTGPPRRRKLLHRPRFVSEGSAQTSLPHIGACRFNFTVGVLGRGSRTTEWSCCVRAVKTFQPCVGLASMSPGSNHFIIGRRIARAPIEIFHACTSCDLFRVFYEGKSCVRLPLYIRTPASIWPQWALLTASAFQCPHLLISGCISMAAASSDLEFSTSAPVRKGRELFFGPPGR
ncbi:hypothetical protein C8R44DRAFT_852886 [Mycena epipterygia]|nr:hypothetical protein C8R44DRAFT_852886 [Mycena epipterygia]